jgi:hypothetical protein
MHRLEATVARWEQVNSVPLGRLWNSTMNMALIPRTFMDRILVRQMNSSPSIGIF